MRLRKVKQYVTDSQTPEEGEEGAQSTFLLPPQRKQIGFGWSRARPYWPSGGPVSDTDAGSTKHQAGPTALSLSHSLGFPSRWTHRHLPRVAAGVLTPSVTKSNLV